jgi:hypothetical protein
MACCSQRRARVPWIVLLSLLGCESEVELAVDLKTDLVPGAEFDGFTATVDGHAMDLFPFEPVGYLDGRRIAEAGGLATGTKEVRIALRRADTETVARTVIVELDASRVISVVITRACVDVMCPPADGSSPERTACSGGTCVDPRCSVDRPDLCPPRCEADEECAPTVACNTASCRDGVCFETPDDALCPGARCNPLTGCTCAVVRCSDPECAGRPCDDGDPCTGAGSCGDGVCRRGAYVGDHVQPDPRNARVRCCAGGAVDIYSNPGHCGGCYLACRGGHPCVADGGRTAFWASCGCAANADCATNVCSSTDWVCSCDPAFGGTCPYICHDRDPGADICSY